MNRQETVTYDGTRYRVRWQDDDREGLMIVECPDCGREDDVWIEDLAERGFAVDIGGAVEYASIEHDCS